MNTAASNPGARGIFPFGRHHSAGLIRCGFPKSLFFTVIAAAAITALLPASLKAESPAAILEKAADQLGTPYRYGGKSPEGFDCSGFVFYLYNPTLPSIPRISRDMARTGSPVSSGSWSPGDLLFYATGSNPEHINHVAIWYGEGYIIHSISNGPETGVVMTPANSSYWKNHYIGSRRVLPFTEERTAPEEEGEIGNANNETGSGSVFSGQTQADEQNANDTGKGSGASEPLPSPPPVKEIIGDKKPEDSPWNDFNGFLRGDWEEWKQSDREAFEEFLRRDAAGI